MSLLEVSPPPPKIHISFVFRSVSGSEEQLGLPETWKNCLKSDQTASCMLTYSKRQFSKLTYVLAIILAQSSLAMMKGLRLMAFLHDLIKQLETLVSAFPGASVGPREAY